jgi:hypothetical protein
MPHDDLNVPSAILPWLDITTDESRVDLLAGGYGAGVRGDRLISPTFLIHRRRS